MNGRTRVSTWLMVAGLAVFLASLLVAPLAGSAAANGYAGAAAVLGVLFVGGVGLVGLAVPAAIHSFARARRNPGHDTHGAIMARMFVAAAVVIAAVAVARFLA